ncbi:MULTISPECIES: formate dehydrogenase accessory sulfurtransferase FdhD [Bradyrhizobium]|uniref:hypothetical protein n=1 Tax=Bradyrhizobium pachyrhizi TaxID=280333 RepID=UPI00128F3B71|nr:hypothetical protein [Bradyrhizobium pachyrhizi]
MTLVNEERPADLAVPAHRDRIAEAFVQERLTGGLEWQEQHGSGPADDRQRGSAEQIPHTSVVRVTRGVPRDAGIELLIWLGSGSASGTATPALVGTTGCGLCGIESLTEASRPLPRRLGRFFLDHGQIERALHNPSNA